MCVWKNFTEKLQLDALMMKEYSLEEARAECRKRWGNHDLRLEVESYLKECLWSELQVEPRAVLYRHIATPDNAHFFFRSLARWLDLRPVRYDLLKDKFHLQNEDKKVLGRLRLVFPDGSKRIVDLVDFKTQSSRMLDEVVMKDGSLLMDFHYGLMRRFDPECEVVDVALWGFQMGNAKDNYLKLFAHFIAHGVYVHDLTLDPFGDNQSETKFMEEVVFWAYDQIKAMFGCDPVTVRLYPETGQTAEEDFYWGGFPKDINDHLVGFVTELGWSSKIVQPKGMDWSALANDNECKG